MSGLEAASTASTTAFFVLIGTGMDLSVLNPFDPANHEGLLVVALCPGGPDRHHLPGADPAAAGDPRRGDDA